MDAMTMRSTHGRGTLFDSILDTVGDSPAIRINRLASPGVEIHVKARPSTPPDR